MDQCKGQSRLEVDTIQAKRCGCVPQLSLVYEDRYRESLDDSAGARGGWARRFPLLGPFWCVRGTNGQTVRRRDNAVYRSNSFKFERRGPESNLPNLQSNPIDQVIETKKPVRSVKEETVNDAILDHQAHKQPVRTLAQQKELLVNLNYSDPQDAEGDSTSWGNINQAYEGEENNSGEELVHQTPAGYKVKFGQDIYYCKPYQPFHTQLRYNFSDLLESGVDSEYEEMAGVSRSPNNNRFEAPCSQCVTVINVCPSPGHTLKQGGAVIPHPKLAANSGAALNEPPYENLSFHKVTINVPDVGEDVHHVFSEKPRVLLRKPPLRKSKVPLKYQGIKRVKSKSKTQKHEHGMLDKSGYSQKEVWNWLYLEEAAKNNGLNIESNPGHENQDQNLESKEKSVSVQFSPAEFLQATNRLAHLNLEGFERFVGNTIDRALAGARAKSSEVLDACDKDKENQILDQSLIDTSSKNNEVYLNGSERDTDVYVSKESNQHPSCGDCKSKVRPICESCLRSGESSCSSALSSLESVKSSLSQGPRSRESESSSARGSYLSNEGGVNDNHGDNGNHMHNGLLPHEYRCANANSNHKSNDGMNHDYMRMSGQKIYRGRIRASLPVGGPSHKPYQTLEVSPEQDKALMSRVQPPTGPNTFSEKQQLHLVDPCIQLHQQEWYHGNVSRLEAEAALRLHPPGSYLVRNCESARKDYSLSLKSSHGFMHMRIQLTPSGHYILGQFSRPFSSIAEMINYYTINRLPIKGAEHVSLKIPLCEQLL